MAGERLRVVRGAAAGSEIPLPAGDFTIGRSEQGIANLSGDPQISAHHARLRRLDTGQVLVEDLGSTNGTYVNGRRIQAPHVLASGDTIAVGATTLTFQDGARETVAGAPGAPASPPPTVTAASPPTVIASPPAPSPPTRPAPPALAAPPAPRPRFAPGTTPHPATAPRRGARPAGLLAAAAVLVAGVVLAIVLLAGGGGRTHRAALRAAASVPADCGAHIGQGSRVAYVTYVESNIARSNRNSVIAIPYAAGSMAPLPMSQCYTGGSGSADLTSSGALDADFQLTTNPQRTLLFAVNQGSDSVAVFQILANGGLRPVPGSPFPSGGKAPGSLGLSGSTLVVSNKAQDGVRGLKATAPTYTTFRVGADGALTPVPRSTVTAKPGSSPDSAYVPPPGGVAVGTEESGPIRGFKITASGVLRQAPGSPHFLPNSVFGPGFDAFNEFPLGVVAHPHLRLLYITVPEVPALAVYSFAPSGRLHFIDSVALRGGYAPCWVRVTSDGRWLYTADADTNNLTAFDLTNPRHPKQLQTLLFQVPGDPWNEALDPRDRYLFLNAPRNDPGVPVGQGNVQHVMKVGTDGKLTELNPHAPVRIPVPVGTNPQGLVVVPGPYASR